jgi:hypothetical protein
MLFLLRRNDKIRVILSFFNGKKGRKTRFLRPKKRKKEPTTTSKKISITVVVSKKRGARGCFQFVLMGFSLHQDDTFVSSGRNIYLVRTN